MNELFVYLFFSCIKNIKYMFQIIYLLLIKIKIKSYISW